MARGVGLCVCTSMCVYVYVCECLLVNLYLLHSEERTRFLTERVRTLLESEGILVSPHNFKGLFEVQTRFSLG